MKFLSILSRRDLLGFSALTAMCAFFFPDKGLSQNIFTSIPAGSAPSLNAQQTTRYNAAVSQSAAGGVSFIQLNSLSGSQLGNGKIQFEAPEGDCGLVKMEAKNVEFHSENDYFWYGEIEHETDCDCNDGSLMIRSKNGERFGTLSLEGQTWSIEDLSGEKNVLAKMPMTGGGNCGTVAGFTGGENEVASDRSPGNCDVSVLVLVTTSAGTVMSGVGATVQNLLDYTNVAFKKSYISDCDLKLVLATDPIAITYNETNKTIFGTSSSVLEEITSGISLTSAGKNVYDLRNDFNADIAVIISSNLAMAGGAAAGVAWFGPNSSQPIAVVSTFSIARGDVFAHEVGHLLGADHELCTDPGSGSGQCRTNAGDIHAHSFTKTKKRCFKPDITTTYKTIMFTNGAGDPNLIQHFSNPSVIHSTGLPTGIAGSSYNAARLINTACTVANFKGGGQPITARIDGESEICKTHSEVLYTQITGAPGPYTITWYKSADGVNWNWVSSDASYELTADGFNVEDVIHLKLTVTTNSSQSDTDFHELTVVSPSNPNSICYLSTFQDPAKPFQDLKISPNPTNGSFELGFEAKQDGPASVFLYDLNGQKLETLFDSSVRTGNQVSFHDLNYLPSGIYLVQLLCDGAIVSKYLVIQH